AGGRKLASGKVPLAAAPLGAITKVGRVQTGTLDGTGAIETELTISIESASGRHENRWKLWGFPRAGLARSSVAPIESMVKSADLQRWFPFLEESTDGVAGALVASELNPRVIETLRAGGRVLLLAEPDRFGGRTTY